MIRLTALLCVGMFVFLLIAGEDRGQVRQGLLAPPLAPSNPVVATVTESQIEQVAEVTETIKATEAVFVPAQPVRVAIETPAPAATPFAPTTPEPQNKFAVVNARSVNVRSGPSTSDAVIGRLAAGEQVLVVADAANIEGWSLVRIEGDGIEGYVATRLLVPAE